MPNTTVDQLLTEFSLEHDSPYEDEVLLKWINYVESNVFEDNIKRYSVQKYARSIGVYQFDLPDSVDFEYVKSLFVNGIKYKKKDVRAYHESRTYWYEDEKLNIYPACTETDDISDPKIRLVYLDKPTKKLIDNIATDTLLIPDKFKDIYEYYFMARIAHLAGESTDYANNMAMFNNRVAEFERWWDDHRPQRPIDEIISSEDDSGYELNNFDYE